MHSIVSSNYNTISNPIDIPQKDIYNKEELTNNSKCEYGLHCNNFNPSKMSPTDIWKLRLEHRINNTLINKC